MTILIMNSETLAKSWLTLRGYQRAKAFNYALSSVDLAIMASRDMGVEIVPTLLVRVAERMGYRSYTDGNGRVFLNISLIKCRMGYKRKPKQQKPQTPAPAPAPIPAPVGKRTSKALPAGKRVSKSGKTYWEYRKNRASYPVGSP